MARTRSNASSPPWTSRPGACALGKLSRNARERLDATRSLAKRQAIVERYFASFADLVRSNPEPHAMDYIHECMVMEKVRGGDG